MTYKSVKEFLEKNKEQEAAIQAGIDFHKLAERGELPATVFEKTPALREFFSDAARAEVPLAGTIGGNFVSRRIDRMTLSEAEVKFLDFKTGGGDADDYRRQMSEYSELLSEIYPGKKIRGFIYWVEKAELQEV
ncbi:MAG: hypothetical protein LBH81_03565 [Rickettsiales bacterium]|jgi:ATP-dependent helicase/nuclease subunit A|nr:hypothetical protein [Rickettsiales bacterium]